MSVVGDAQREDVALGFSRPIVDHSLSVLTLDIETSPNLGYAFGVWDQNLTPDKIVDRSRVLVVGAKWYGRAPVIVLSERKTSHEDMVQRAWALVDQADIIVHYNGKKFDMRHLRREWLEAGLPPPAPYKQIDLLPVVKRQFAYGSNKLDNISQVLGVGAKIKHEGFELWKLCLAGDPSAFRRMERYCAGDVRLTERLYDRLRPWISGHPHITTADELRCTQCGSQRLEQMPRDYRAVVIAYAAYRCSDCGGMVRASYPKRVALSRAIP
jgi:DNA-directed RNA polymerase subunit RPC12/RpoP/DNA polymerase elongation subunit (family B)